MTRTSSTGPITDRLAVIYQCPDCDQRFLGKRRCPDCQLFCRRVGLGGDCPHCDQPVAIDDLIQQVTPLTP